MKILITGGTGFVGSAMAQALHAQGHVVTVIGSSGKSCRRHQAMRCWMLSRGCGPCTRSVPTCPPALSNSSSPTPMPRASA